MRLSERFFDEMAVTAPETGRERLLRDAEFVGDFLERRFPW